MKGNLSVLQGMLFFQGFHKEYFFIRSLYVWPYGYVEYTIIRDVSEPNEDQKWKWDKNHKIKIIITKKTKIKLNRLRTSETSRTLSIRAIRNKETVLLHHILIYTKELWDDNGSEPIFIQIVTWKWELLEQFENKFDFSLLPFWKINLLFTVQW